MKIPEMLYGEYKEVKKGWRAVTRSAVRGGNWDVALAEEPMVRLEDIDGSLVTKGPYPLPDRHIFLYQVMFQLLELTDLGHDRADEANAVMRRLVVDGLKRPWFCLALLGGSSFWLRGAPNFRSESPPLAALALSKLLEMWPAFVALDDRFAEGYGGPAPWPGWQGFPFALCSYIGIPEHELRPLRVASFDGEIDVWEAAEKMRAWVKRWRSENADRDIIS